MASYAALALNQTIQSIVTRKILADFVRPTIGAGYDPMGQTPVVLESNIAATAALTDPVRQYFFQTLGSWVQIQSEFLDALIGGEREQSQKRLETAPTLSRSDAYRDAEVHWRSYQNRDLASAVNGFEYLRNSHPLDPYFRTVLAEVYTVAGRWDDALREASYARWLDPSRDESNTLLLRCLMRGQDIQRPHTVGSQSGELDCPRGS